MDRTTPLPKLIWAWTDMDDEGMWSDDADEIPSQAVEYVPAAEVLRLREAISRVLEPTPGVKLIEPWAYGILRAALSPA